MSLSPSVIIALSVGGGSVALCALLVLLYACCSGYGRRQRISASPAVTALRLTARPPPGEFKGPITVAIAANVPLDDGTPLVKVTKYDESSQRWLSSTAELQNQWGGPQSAINGSWAPDPTADTPFPDICCTPSVTPDTEAQVGERAAAFGLVGYTRCDDDLHLGCGHYRILAALITSDRVGGPPVVLCEEFEYRITPKNPRLDAQAGNDAPVARPEPPTIIPAHGDITTSTRITITASRRRRTLTSGGRDVPEGSYLIRYAVDGPAGDPPSTVYHSPFTIDDDVEPDGRDVTIRAIVSLFCLDGGGDTADPAATSAVAVATLRMFPSWRGVFEASVGPPQVAVRAHGAVISLSPHRAEGLRLRVELQRAALTEVFEIDGGEDVPIPPDARAVRAWWETAEGRRGASNVFSFATGRTTVEAAPAVHESLGTRLLGGDTALPPPPRVTLRMEKMELSLTALTKGDVIYTLDGREPRPGIDGMSGGSIAHGWMTLLPQGGQHPPRRLSARVFVPPVSLDEGSPRQGVDGQSWRFGQLFTRAIDEDGGFIVDTS